MTLNSNYRRLCSVELPYSGRQKYMHTFDLEHPQMPDGYGDYLYSVTRLCHAAGAMVGLAHITVDEKIVAAGMSQRRPNPHVDGCFVPSQRDWSHPAWHHGGWAHGCNNIPLDEFKRMSVIVASSVIGCRAWRGTFDGQPAADGDLSHLVLGEGEIIPAKVGYLLSPDCIHESMIQSQTVQRTFLRIALPVEFQYAV